jgi:hypothetical protein
MQTLIVMILTYLMLWLGDASISCHSEEAKSSWLASDLFWKNSKQIHRDEGWVFGDLVEDWRLFWWCFSSSSFVLKVFSLKKQQ